MKEIADKIKAKGVTAKHVAKQLGISPITLSKIVNGKQSFVSDDLVLRINAYLDRIST